MQLVFGRDAILNTKFEANWKLIKQNKQKRIKQNNENENKKRIRHHYKKGDKVFFKELEKNKFGNNWGGRPPGEETRGGQGSVRHNVWFYSLTKNKRLDADHGWKIEQIE